MSPAQLLKLRRREQLSKQRQQLAAQREMLIEGQAAAAKRASDNELLSGWRYESMRVTIVMNESGERVAALTSFNMKKEEGQPLYHTLEQLQARRKSLIADGFGSKVTEKAIRLLTRGVLRHTMKAEEVATFVEPATDITNVVAMPKRTEPAKRRKREKVAANG